MNFRDAKIKSIKMRALGAIVIIPATISTIISILKMMYLRLDDGTQLGSAIARPFQEMVLWAYQNTQYLGFFWGKSPTPNHMEPAEPNNLYFAAIYLLIFLGSALYASGSRLSTRLSKIDEEIENQIIKESIRGEKARNREEIERTTEIPSSSTRLQLHQLYIAPIVTAVIGAIIMKIIGI